MPPGTSDFAGHSAERSITQSGSENVSRQHLSTQALNLMRDSNNFPEQNLHTSNPDVTAMLGGFQLTDRSAQQTQQDAGTGCQLPGSGGERLPQGAAGTQGGAESAFGDAGAGRLPPWSPGFRAEGQAGSDSSTDKTKDVVAPVSDASLASKVPFETFTPEQIRTLPVEQLQQAVEKNQEQLVAFTQENYSKLPNSVGAHGGTRESNDIWLASGGTQMVPDGAKSGNRENNTWMWAFPNKPADASQYLADLSRSIDLASGYAEPSHVKQPYTPGGVALMDVGTDVSSRPWFWSSGLNSNKMPVDSAPVVGLGNSENTRPMYLADPAETFASGYKGMIDVSQINQLNPLVSELAYTPGQRDRYEVAKALQNQMMAAEGLKVLLSDTDTTPGGDGASMMEQPTPGFDSASRMAQPTPGFDGASRMAQPTAGFDSVVDWAEYDRIAASRQSQ